MRASDLKPNAAKRVWAIAALVLLASSCAACAGGSQTPQAGATPADSVAPDPNYTAVCAPLGADTSSGCIRVTLDAIDSARSKEGMKPMVLPADLAQLSVPEQLFVALDRERVDRGLTPFPGLSVALDEQAQKAAAAAQLPPRPGRSYSQVSQEWIGAVANGLDADYQWMYYDGPDSGVPQCSGSQTSGCWADRAIVLDRFGSGHLVVGIGFDASGDTGRGDRGGSSLTATLAVDNSGSHRYAYTWKQALATMANGTLSPLRRIPASESDTGIRDPSTNIDPVPDYTQICAPNGLDDSAACINAVLAAINHAHSLEGIRPVVLPTDFAQLNVPDQLFVAVNLERIDRSLAPFVGLTASLNKNAQRGADDANDPPDPGHHYVLDDAEWAGGSSNGLDAVYGWMYDDGYNSGNLDCVRRDAPGCWGHRKGILDDFGSGSNLVMGAALDDAGDTHDGDNGGTSMAVTLAVAAAPARVFTYSWAQVEATLAQVPGSSST